MVMFSSVEREDVEPDCPYYQRTGNQKCNRGCWQEPLCITDEPYGGWLKPQHNAPNPILILFRDSDGDGDRFHLAQLWLGDIDEWHEDGGMGIPTTPEQIEHARRVLTRYVAMKRHLPTWP